MKTCPFCSPTDVIQQNDLSYAKYDRYPVTPGHLLIIPKRHFSDFFQATEQEIMALFDLLHNCKAYLEAKYKPDGYNIGINCGEAAGQTIFHVHIHLIPRYQGDIDQPQGGVRGVIPEKRIYT